ncbi:MULTISPECIES: hypothetical protein [Bacteroidales]|uniref:hypothetical protein n=1 Tax=Bacteroidales TaxID=171549 RepID=UPI001093DB0F|nr:MULTISPECIES: hypothetical protein [Bacteroidales]TGY03751.1 hypothetical protein E5354_09685 [Muribaculum sp. NM65_B17]THG42376.1 hypothetical protein E5985_09690 [Muribaculaceae bacterium]GFI38294.1 hypothetical protein IMSAGC016_00054 [Muribaculaceae bacterium]GFI67308.1 hypothetical protein IMSAG192_00836 [Muribaculaceae bacterium]
MKYQNVIGIDPDIDKSGVAHLNVKNRTLEVSTLSFARLVDYFDYVVERQKATGQSVIVVVEASWMVKSNWHLKFGSRKEYAAATGYKVGQNHQTGKLICEMARAKGLEVLEHAPLRKCWKGKDGKITADELQQITGLIGRTNQESRDAVLLAWCYANLPIRLKCV